MTRAYSLDLRERVVAFVAGGQTTQGGLSRVRCQCGERREVDATRKGKRQRGRQAHGRQSYVHFFWRRSAIGCWRAWMRSPT